MTNLQKTTNNLYKFVFMPSLILLSSFTISVNARTSRIMAISDSTKLSAFEGIYQQKDNEFAYVKITAINNKLVAKQLEGDRQFTLTRKSEFIFETKDDDGDETITVTFTRNNSGDIAQFAVADKQTFIKVKDYVPAKEVKLTAAQLKAFEGKYQFEEKSDAYLQITATADGLTLRQLWDGKEINFMAISDLAFLNKQMGFPLKFTKDANGNVIKVLAFNRDMWDKVKE